MRIEALRVGQHPARDDGIADDVTHAWKTHDRAEATGEPQHRERQRPVERIDKQFVPLCFVHTCVQGSRRRNTMTADSRALAATAATGSVRARTKAPTSH